MADLTTLKRRAQAIADNTLSPRWVLHTSLGWRIEREAPHPELGGPFFRFDPSPTACKRADKQEAE